MSGTQPQYHVFEIAAGLSSDESACHATGGGCPGIGGSAGSMHAQLGADAAQIAAGAR